MPGSSKPMPMAPARWADATNADQKRGHRAARLWPGRLIRGAPRGQKSTASASIGLPHDGERAEFLTEDSVFIEFIKYLTKIDKDLFEPTLAREVDFNFTIKRVREL
jgi:hypothetical protein